VQKSDDEIVYRLIIIIIIIIINNVYSVVACKCVSLARPIQAVRIQGRQVQPFYLRKPGDCMEHSLIEEHGRQSIVTNWTENFSRINLGGLISQNFPDGGGACPQTP